MAYTVDFWLAERYNHLQLHSNSDPFIDGTSDDSIYMNVDEFFKMVNEYAGVGLYKEAWQRLKDNITDETSLKIINETQKEFEQYCLEFEDSRIEKENKG